MGWNRSALMVTPVVAALAVAGCGSSSKSSAGGATPSAAGSSASSAGSPSAAASSASSGSSSGGATITAAQAKSYATAVNLKATDLPGYTSKPQDDSETAQDKKFEKQFTSCVGVPDNEPDLADVESPDFDKGDDLDAVEFSSEVDVLTSKALVDKDFALLSSGKAGSCLQKTLKPYLTSLLSGDPSVTLGNPTVVQLNVSVPGAGKGSGLRTTVPFSGPGGSTSVVFDLIALAVGQAEVTLNAQTFGTPPDAATEQSLANVLVTRASSA